MYVLSYRLSSGIRMTYKHFNFTQSSLSLKIEKKQLSQIIQIYLRAIISMATKEHGLSSVIAEAIVFEPRNITTLRIVITHTAFKILVQKEKEGKRV